MSHNNDKTLSGEADQGCQQYSARQNLEKCTSQARGGKGEQSYGDRFVMSCPVNPIDTCSLSDWLCHVFVSDHMWYRELRNLVSSVDTESRSSRID